MILLDMDFKTCYKPHKLWRCSSVGQSIRLISEGSAVQICSSLQVIFLELPSEREFFYFINAGESMKFINYGESLSPPLRDFFYSHPHFSIWHTQEWLSLQRHCHLTQGVNYFGIVDPEGEIVLGGIIQFRKHSVFKFGYIQGGILYHRIDSSLYQMLVQGLRKTGRNQHLTYCLVDWNVPFDEQWDKIVRETNRHDFKIKPLIPQFSNVLDITKSEELLLKEMKPKGRYNIKLAEKKGVQVKEGTFQDLPFFYQILLETIKRDGFRAHSESYYAAFLKYLPQAKFLIAKQEGELLAAGIFIYCGKQALYYYGASSNHKRNFMAAYLLQWEAIRLGRQKGASYYDFMGIANPASSGDPLVGVTDFKMKFGDGVVKFNSSYHLIFSFPRYWIFKTGLWIKRMFAKRKRYRKK